MNPCLNLCASWLPRGDRRPKTSSKPGSASLIQSSSSIASRPDVACRLRAHLGLALDELVELLQRYRDSRGVAPSCLRQVRSSAARATDLLGHLFNQLDRADAPSNDIGRGRHQQKGLAVLSAADRHNARADLTSQAIGETAEDLRIRRIHARGEDLHPIDFPRLL